ncbi:MAG: hypothetical protein ACK481_10315 [Candidatus Melainabacteria bacterium]
MPFALNAASRGIPFIFVFPEKELIPLPYVKEIEKLKEACGQISNISFYHSDKEDLKGEISRVLGQRKRLLFVETDFPHSVRSLGKQSSEVHDGTPDCNLESLYGQLAENKNFEIYYAGIDHHANSSSERRVKESSNGVFINNPSKGVCWVPTQELMPYSPCEQIFGNPLLLPLKNLLKKISFEFHGDLTPLYEIHDRFAMSAIGTDYYINILNGQLVDNAEAKILAGTLEFPQISDLINSLQLNPHLVDLVFQSDEEKKSKAIDLLNQSKKGNDSLSLRKLHYLLAQHLHDEGKKIIVSNDEKVETVLNGEAQNYYRRTQGLAEEICAELGNSFNFNNISRSLTKFQIELQLQISKHYQSLSADKAASWASILEHPENFSESSFIALVEKFMEAEVEREGIQLFVIVDRASYLGELIVEAYQNTELSLDDIRRLVARGLMNYINKLEGHKHLTIVFPIDSEAYAIVSKTGDSSADLINSKSVVGALQDIQSFQGGGGPNSSVGAFRAGNNNLAAVKKKLQFVYGLNQFTLQAS